MSTIKLTITVSKTFELDYDFDGVIEHFVNAEDFYPTPSDLKTFVQADFDDDGALILETLQDYGSEIIANVDISDEDLQRLRTVLDEKEAEAAEEDEEEDDEPEVV